MNKKNMMGLALGLISIVGCTLSYAEAKDNFSDEKNINFGGNYLEQFKSVIGTKDGNFVVVGRTSSTDVRLSNVDEDAIIAKYDREGNQLWIKSYGDVDSGGNGDMYYAVTERNTDGNLIAVGCTSSSSPDGGNSTAIIACYSEEGDELWVKRAFSLDDISCFNGVQNTKDGGFVVSGYTYSDKAVLTKYDGYGNEEWCVEYGDGLESCLFDSVTELKDGRFVAVGRFYYGGGFAVGGFNYCRGLVVIVDENGNITYEKKAKEFDNLSYNSVTRTFDGGFVAVGKANLSTDSLGLVRSSATSVISKYSSSGNLEWTRNFGESSYEQCFSSVVEMKDGSYLAFGLSGDNNPLEGFNGGYWDGVIVKYDKKGNQEWVKYVGGSGNDAIFGGTLLPDGTILCVGFSDSSDNGFTNNGELDAFIYSVKVVSDEEEAVLKAESSNSIIDIENARDAVNKMEESLLREELQNRLDALNFNEVLERKTASANVDVYIKCENVLMMSLDTNSVTFDDFSGVEDMEKTNAVNISINSSLPYQLNAYLPTEIQNSDKSNTMDKRILNIKENSESTYQTFANTTDKLVLKDNCPAGNDLVHGVDIKLKGGIAHEKDVYKTTIKFEAEQK